MVHALSEAHRVLKPGAILIDLRPAARNRRVELELAEARLHIGEIDSANTFADHVVADDTLRSALAAGQFQIEHRASFELLTDMDTAADLREYAAGLRRSKMPKTMLPQIEQLTADAEGDYIIRSRRDMLIARYRKSPSV